MEGFSGSDIKEVCRAAAAKPLREFARQQSAAVGASSKSSKAKKSSAAAPAKMRSISLEDFRTALRSVRPTGETAYEYHDKSGGFVQPSGGAAVDGTFSGGASSGGSPPLNGGVDPSNPAFLAGVQWGLMMAAAAAGAQQSGNGTGNGNGAMPTAGPSSPTPPGLRPNSSYSSFPGGGVSTSRASSSARGPPRVGSREAFD